MEEKIKTKKGFIQIPILIAIIVSIAVVSGIGYGAIEYHKTSKIIKESEQLTKEERYDEAIKKLEVTQNKFLGKTILKQKINAELEKNKKLLADKTKYNEGVNKLNEGDLQGSIDLLSELPENSFYYQKAQTKIEEAKRKMLEEELSEAQKTRKEAEAKAKQEEFEKKLKEQQLINKEAEERMMNADNDGDGLTYREELQKGTSDWNKDSDFDGIPDNLDLHPAGGGRYQAQTFTWSYGGYNWTWTANIHEDWYEYYKAKRRSPPLSLEYITSNDPFIKEVAKKISETAEKNNLSKSALAVAFVQSLSYLDDVYTGYDEYPKYPVETFFEKNGDCEDMSYLTASIVDAMNIDSVLIVLPGHMAVGIWFDCEMPGTYYKVGDRCYYYTETTGEGWFSGEIPDKYKYTTATLIKIPSGEKITVSPQYKKPCYASPDFPGYYFDGKNYYSDSQCNYLAYCMPYKEFYINPQTLDFYWDSSCSQLVVKGCSKSTYYPGYFFDGIDYYYDSQCTQKARVCRPSSIYSDRYWDGYNNYWDSNCTQKIVPGCYKSTYRPGYFFDGWDYYYDYQCTQKASF
jgi:hypothetical protein